MRQTPSHVIAEELLVGDDYSVVYCINGADSTPLVCVTRQGMADDGVTHDSNTMQYNGGRLMDPSMRKRIMMIASEIARHYARRGVRGTISIDFKGGKPTEVNNRPGASTYGECVGIVREKNPELLFLRNTNIELDGELRCPPRDCRQLMQALQAQGLDKKVTPFLTCLLQRGGKFLAMIQGSSIEEIDQIAMKLKKLEVPELSPSAAP